MDLSNLLFLHRQYVFLASKVTHNLPVSHLWTNIKDRGWKLHFEGEGLTNQKLRQFKIPYTIFLNYVPTCLLILRASIPTCHHFSQAYVSTCSRAYIHFLFLLINYFVHTCSYFYRTVLLSQLVHAQTLKY